MKKNETSLTKETSFIKQLLDFGIWKCIQGVDFRLSAGFIALYYFDQKYNWNILSHNDNDSYITTIIAASSILFALTITSLSIILSFSSSNFVKFVQKNNQLSSLLFPFWIGNGAYLLSISFSLLYFIINKGTFPVFHSSLFIISVGLFIYALINTFYLLATIIRFGYFISVYENVVSKD